MYSPFSSCTSQSSGLSHSVDPGQLHSSLSLNSNAWFLPPSGSAYLLLSNLSLRTWDLDQAIPGSHSTSSAHMVPVWGQQQVADFEVRLFISSLILKSCSLKSSTLMSCFQRLCQGKGKTLNPSCIRAPHGQAGVNGTKEVLMGWSQYPLSGLHVLWLEVSLSCTALHKLGRRPQWTAKGRFSLPSQSSVEISAQSTGHTPWLLPSNVELV